MKSLLRRIFIFSLVVEALAVSTCCHALTILSGPSFIQATNAPLAGLLQLTTDTDSRVGVVIHDGTKTWQRHFYDYGTSHSVPLLGFMPNRTNSITVMVYDRYRNEFTAPKPLQFVTSPLPADFPSITLLHADPARMEPGYTLFRVGVHNETYWYVTIVDSAGEVVWYGASPSTADVRLLGTGNLFMPSTNRFVEMNLLGQTVNSWVALTNLPINVHDGVPTSHGTILYLSDAVEVVTNYPTSMTNSSAQRSTANIRYQKVVEISATNAALLNTWLPINELDPWRITYMIDMFAGAWTPNTPTPSSRTPATTRSSCPCGCRVQSSNSLGRLGNCGGSWAHRPIGVPHGNPTSSSPWERRSSGNTRSMRPSSRRRAL